MRLSFHRTVTLWRKSLLVKFIIKSLIIIDYDSKKANKFNFGEQTNLIVSTSNTTGKSSLLKSLYYALGVSLKSIPDKWDINSYIFQVVIEVDNLEYMIERHNKIMSVKENGEVTVFKDFKEYSEWLQKVLKMNLSLVNIRGDSLSLAYASAIFAPLYIDQDTSWDGIIFKNTFSDLGQYRTPDFQKDVIAYYLGLGDAELKFYEQEQSDIKQQINHKKISIDEIDNVYTNYKDKFNVSEDITSDIGGLENQVNEFIEKTNTLSQEISKTIKKLSQFKVELDIYKQDKSEMEKISKDIKNRLDNIEYECSYCHSKLTREQSLTRLELKDDLSEIHIKKKEIEYNISVSTNEYNKENDKLRRLKREFSIYKERISEINEILTIKDYVNQKVLKELGDLRRKEDSQYLALNLQKDELAKQIRKIKADIRKRKETMKAEFELLKNSILTSIGNAGISQREFDDFSKINGSGTEKNKNLLSLYLIYINLVSKYSSYNFPVTIDSFTKNELDKVSEENMYKSVSDYFLTLPNQTFFAIIEDNLKYIDCEHAHIIEIKKPVLLEEQYEQLSVQLFNQVEDM